MLVVVLVVVVVEHCCCRGFGRFPLESIYVGQVPPVTMTLRKSSQTSARSSAAKRGFLLQYDDARRFWLRAASLSCIAMLAGIARAPFAQQ